MLKAKKISNNELEHFTLFKIVKDNVRTATIFEKYNLDFYCNGNRTLANVCAYKGINRENIIKEIEEINSTFERDEIKPDEWKLDFLIKYIINNHHKYVSKMLPIITAHTQKVALENSGQRTETKRIFEIFAAINIEIRHHMMKEEKILFPHINVLLKTGNKGGITDKPYFGTIKNPIAMMENEHKSAGDGMAIIRKLTNNYTPLSDANTTYKITLKELKEFEEDLHKHIHLENYILFPKAIKLEEALSG